ncbi:MAG: NDP-sugar synthase, partial [Acidobacteria bacterium]|nr:NDP-sugar synthase [Acidobacteriota bacterium]
MRGMILAAGFGTRFQPVTHSLPKPMIPVLNRPLLGWAVEACLASGINELIVNLHHIPEPIRAYLAEEYGHRASFELSEEEEILGTGGALRKVRHLLEEEFVLMNGDTIQWPPFIELLETRRAQDALACLLLRHPPAGESFTRVWLRDGRITGFGEGEGEPLMFAGAHAMSPELVDLLPDRDFSGLTEDVYMPATERGTPRLAGHVRDGPWFDVGKPTRYMEATRGLLTALRDSLIEPPSGSEFQDGSLRHGSAVIEGAVAASSIGARTRIEAGVEVRDSVLWEYVTVGKRSSVSGSIIAHGIALPEGSRAQNVLVAPALDGLDYRDDGTVIGDWVTRPVDET